MGSGSELGSISSISAILAALTAVIGGTVLLSGRRRPSHLAFLFLSTSIFFWHLFSIFRTSVRMTYIALGVLMVIPVSLLGFLRTFLHESAQSRDQPGGVPRTAVFLLLTGEVALIYSYALTYSGSAGEAAGTASPLWALRIPTLLKSLTLLGLYGALTPLWQVYRSTVSRVDKRRLLYLVGVGALSITFTAWDLMPQPFGRGSPALGSVLTVVYLYFLQQTLFVDRLLDINELLGKVVVLSAFVLLLSAIHMLLTIIGVEQRQVVTVVAFVLLLLYEPLRRFLEGQVHRFAARDRFEMTQHLTELRQTLTNIIEPREAVRLVLSVFEETRRLTHASVYLLEPDGNGYELAGHFGVRPTERLDAAARRPLLARLLATRQAITLDQLEREHNTLTAKRDTASEVETLDAIARTLVELHAGAVIGIFAGKPSEPQRTGRHPTSSGTMPRIEGAELLVPSEALLGVLCIKDERVSDAFASAELDVLIGVAAQLGITLQNSKLYERMKERDRLAALGQMAAGLAHEIRNPLGAIKGAAEFIAPLPDGKVPEDTGDFLHIIVDETKRLNRVVSQFLDYARPFRGDMEQLDINDVVRKLVVMFRPLVDEIVSARRGPPAAGRELGAGDSAEPSGSADQLPEIALDLAPDLPRIRGDAEQLRQVFLNLAINAIQAMTEAMTGEPSEPGAARGKLTLSSGLRHGGRLGALTPHIEVRFTDTGPGITPTAMKSLFIPFFTTKERGTGLGLPISQRIVENHGGFIEVRSRAGGGATFIVVLPVGE
jgi:signal transduction histidine kinase